MSLEHFWIFVPGPQRPLLSTASSKPAWKDKLLLRGSFLPTNDGCPISRSFSHDVGYHDSPPARSCRLTKSSRDEDQWYPTFAQTTSEIWGTSKTSLGKKEDQRPAYTPRRFKRKSAAIKASISSKLLYSARDGRTVVSTPNLRRWAERNGGLSAPRCLPG